MYFRMEKCQAGSESQTSNSSSGPEGAAGQRVTRSYARSPLLSARLALKRIY